MSLIRVSANCLVNSDHISSIEQKKIRDKEIIIVYVGNKSYTLDISFDEFLKQLMPDPQKQFFAG